jgi:hypothetical protein
MASAAPARFTGNFWEKFPTPGLVSVRNELDRVLDFRARQFDLFAPPAPEPANLIAMPAPKEIVHVQENQIGEVLSPSQVSTWLDCQTRWYYKYALGLPDYKGATLALGIAFHQAIAENFAQKIETKADLPVFGVVALFRQAWAEQVETARFQPDEDPGEIAATGEACTAKYMEEAAPFIEPAAVELAVSGEIAGVRVRGRVDVLDLDGTIIDAKTASKSPHGIDQSYRRQLATYVQITPGASGVARLDTVTKTKTTKLVPQSFSVDAADRAHVEALFPLVQEGMRNGLYMPNRGSNLCSQRHCPYWERCEDEYGGRVDLR